MNNNFIKNKTKKKPRCAGLKLVQGVASIAAGVKSGFSSIIWIGALKSIFNHVYGDMLMSAKDDTYIISVTHNPINLTSCINELLKHEQHSRS